MFSGIGRSHLKSIEATATILGTSAAAREGFDELVQAFGVPATGIVARLRVGMGGRAVLGVSEGDAPAIAGFRVATHSVEEYRRWIGPESEASSANWTVPAGPWRGEADVGIEQLSAVEHADIEKAARMYIFGDALRVQSYRQLIERCYAPFEAVVYAIRELRVESGAELRIGGAPAILLAETVDLHEHGKIVILDTPCKAHLGHFTKRELSPSSIH